MLVYVRGKFQKVRCPYKIEIDDRQLVWRKHNGYSVVWSAISEISWISRSMYDSLLKS